MSQNKLDMTFKGNVRADWKNPIGFAVAPCGSVKLGP